MSGGETFDWDNFYSENNAHIVETLLDQDACTIESIANALFHGESQRVVDILNDLFLKWEQKKLEDKMQGLPWLELLYDRSIMERPLVSKTTKIRADKTLAVLINEGHLPKKLYYLPGITMKNSETKIASDDLINQQNQFFQKNEYLLDSQPENIVTLPLNQSESRPTTFTYEEAVKYVKGRGLPESLIYDACTDNKIGCYLRLKEESVNTRSRHSAWGSVDYFRQFNNGNPYYPKRYIGLERLSPKDAEHLLMTSHARIDFEKHHWQEVQTTNLETKAHLKRVIKNHEGSWSITADNIFFIREEIIIVIDSLVSKKPKQRQKRLELFNSAYLRIMDRCKENGIILNKHKLPGNAKAWIDLMTKIEPELSSFKWTKDIIRDAFLKENMIISGRGRGLEKKSDFLKIKVLFDL